MGVVFFTTQVISPATLLSQTYEEIRAVCLHDYMFSSSTVDTVT